MSEKTRSFLGGMTVLGLTGIICKVVGVLYRIPLAIVAGSEGLGTYQQVFPSYNMLLTIGAAGLPVAVSRMVSSSLAMKDPRNARRIFTVAVRLLAVIGLVTSLLLALGSRMLSQWVTNPETALGFLAISPALFLVCTMSALRGFMQGQRDMKPTAITQLIEQVGKVALALPLAWLGSRWGIAYSAAGALLGTSVAEGVALLYIFIISRRRMPAFMAREQDESREIMSTREILRQLLIIAIPITLSSCIVPLASTIDSGMLVTLLVNNGMARKEAVSLYGNYSGMVLVLINVPTALAQAISMSLVPAISHVFTLNKQDAVRRQASQGLRFAFLLGFPCSLGLSVLAKPILSLLYSATLTPESLEITAQLLQVSALTVVVFMLVQATSAILQGMRRQRIPMYTLMLGVLPKILLNYLLVKTPSVNIHGAPIASLTCYTVSAVPNLIFVMKIAKMPFDWKEWIAKPLGASAVMYGVVYAAKRMLPEGRLTTVALLVLGVTVFVAVAIAIGALKKEDLTSLRRKKA